MLSGLISEAQVKLDHCPPHQKIPHLEFQILALLEPLERSSYSLSFEGFPYLDQLSFVLKLVSSQLVQVKLISLHIFSKAQYYL